MKYFALLDTTRLCMDHLLSLRYSTEWVFSARGLTRGCRLRVHQLVWGHAVGLVQAVGIQISLAETPWSPHSFPGRVLLERNTNEHQEVRPSCVPPFWARAHPSPCRLPRFSVMCVVMMCEGCRGGTWCWQDRPEPAAAAVGSADEHQPSPHHVCAWLHSGTSSAAWTGVCCPRRQLGWARPPLGLHHSISCAAPPVSHLSG